MFTNKQISLLHNKESKEFNSFIREGLKASTETISNNGALKYSTTGNLFIDNFASISRFKEPRSYDDIAKDMETLWSINPLLTVKLAVYIRIITRKTIVHMDSNSEILDVQKGQGLKHEGIMRFMWLAINHPKTFKINIPYFIAAGSWKDIFKMLSLDLQYNGWSNRQLDWNFLYKVICAGLNNPNTTSLVRKYLPTIRTNSKSVTIESQANTLIGRWIASRLFTKDGNSNYYVYNKYRHLKSDGEAHDWQQKISKQLYESINFDTIAGKALSLLVGSKFLENHNLTEKYSKWILSKPVAKFTGFVFELFKPLDNHQILKDYQKQTIQAQFNKLVETGKENVKSKLLVVRDISNSMSGKAIGTNMSSYGIAKAMALYFSEFLEGSFKNTYAIFSDTCKLETWKGDSVCDKWNNDRGYEYGITNFLSIAKLLINIKNKGVLESEFPTGILALSDGEFNITDKDTTNFNRFREMLKEGGFSEDYVNNFKLILWDLPNYYYGGSAPKFEDFADAPNNFYLSGYDPSAISFILGNGNFKRTPKNAEELFRAAMNQELLNEISIVITNKVSTNNKHKNKLK